MIDRVSPRSLLEGALAAKASEAVDALARDLAVAEVPPHLGPSKVIDLSAGKAGIAVFLDEVARATGDARHAEAAGRIADESVAGMGEQALKPALFGGFTGIAWAVARLSDDPDATSEIDEALLGLVERPAWDGLVDLSLGLVGYGVYLLARPRTPVTDAALAHIARHLVATSRSAGDETWWATPEWSLPEVDVERYPPGTLDLGMSHGVAGIASFLAAAWERLEDAPRALLAPALRWLWSQRLPVDDDGPAFPERIVGGAPRGGGRAIRTRWCHGELGIGIALLHGRVLGDDAWRERGLSVLRRIARRDPGACGIGDDPGVCHGAACIAHVFARAAQITGDGELADASRGWFERLLALRRPGAGLADFPSNEPGLLALSGTGLALLRAITPGTMRSPGWDSALLL